jgi:hypothetical protein
MEAIHIEINNHRKVFAIRELFTNKFKNLKLEFYAKPHTDDGPHSDKIVRNSSFTIGDCRTGGHTGMLTVKPEMTALELKNDLRDTFGLEIEIYKWVDASWQIIDSNDMTLEKLNRLNSISV